MSWTFVFLTIKMTRSNCCSSAQVSWWWWRWWGHFPDDQKVLRHFDVLLRHTTPQTHTQKRGQYLNSHSSFVFGGGCFFFFLFLWSRSCGSFSCNRTVAALSFFFKRDGWMDAEEDVKTKKLFRFLVFFSFSLRDSVRRRHLFRGVLFFFSPLKNKTKSQLPLRQLDWIKRHPF